MDRIRAKNSGSDSNGGGRSAALGRRKGSGSISEWVSSETEPSPRIIRSGSSRASSIRSYRMDDDDRYIPQPDPDVHMEASYSRKRVPQSDSYTPVRAAASAGSDPPTRYPQQAAIRVADADVETDPYVALKVAGTRRTGAHVPPGIIYDSSSGGEEESDEQEEFEDSEVGESGSEEEEEEDGSPKVRISVAGSGSQRGDDNAHFSEMPRAGIRAGDDGRNQAYARVSVAGSASEHGDDEFPKYAAPSVASGDFFYGEDAMDRSARASGSESDRGRESYPRVGVAGHAKDGYARLSVAGSQAESRRVGIRAPQSKVEHADEYSRDLSGNARPIKVDPVVESRASLGVEELKNEVEEAPEKDKDQDIGDKECAAYQQLSPELQAKLQYQVRVILISPLFELKRRTFSAFLDLYRKKFGQDEGFPGFGSIASLCQAMPSVCQRKQAEDNEELILVDSSETTRLVFGIRSGLRRIVYDALNSETSEEITCSEFEERCSEQLGSPLIEVLTEHGYDTPTVECLIKDMPDIAVLKESGPELSVYLCKGADDPARTDGLLIRSPAKGTTSSTKATQVEEVVSKLEVIKEAPKESEDKMEVSKESELSPSEPERLKIEFVKNSELLHTQPERLKNGSSITLRSLKNEFIRPTDFSPSSMSFEDEFLQVKLRMRILLAFCNSGHGVEMTESHDLYEKTFSRSLNLQELGFKLLEELARDWQDVFLLHESKPGWVFLVPSEANRRILNTLRTSLRSSVFSVLVETYPDGLDPLDFLHKLQEAMSGELWEVLDAAGYICSDTEKAESVLSSSSSSDFQLVDFEEICVLLDDMMDFVRLGSNEDGSVVVKLRNADVPLVDLVECKLDESDMGNFDELFVNLMMRAVDGTEISDTEDGAVKEGSPGVGRVQSLVKSFEGTGGLRPSQTTNILRLKHELRLILGSPEFCETGVALTELCNIYTDRTGQELSSKSKVKILLRAVPDIVSKDSSEEFVHLSKTPKNLRILSATRAGLRQVLFWALLKNPGGIWATLLEGWFTDFSGVSLVSTLQLHGYELSKSKPLYPVCVFLKDMSDLLQRKPAPLEIYKWSGELKDPVHSDASLLGLLELLIQYDPLRFNQEIVAQRAAELVKERDLSPPKEDNGPGETAVLESYLLQEYNGDAKAGSEALPALNGTANGYEFDRGLKLDHQDRTEEMQHRGSEPGDDLGNGHVEGPVGQTGAVVNEGDAGKFSGSGEAEEPLGPTETLNNEETNEELSRVSLKEEIQEVQTPEATGRGEEESGEVEEAAGQRGTVENVEFGKLSNESSREETLEVQEPDSNVADATGRGENEESIAEDKLKIKGDDLLSVDEAYAQLRVTGKGPKVNLDEWQFTDSEEEEEEYEDSSEEEEEYEEEEEHNSTTVTPIKASVPMMPRVSGGGGPPPPKAKETGKDSSRSWILPNKSPWKL